MEFEFKGTRGKWNVEFKKDMISIHTGENSQDVEIGNGIWHDPNICGIWADIDYEERGTCEANAKLISAAPELLSACITALELSDKTFLAGNMRGRTPEMKACYEKVKSAINKALGK